MIPFYWAEILRFTSAIDAPKLICNTFPLGVTNAGTDFTPHFRLRIHGTFRCPNELPLLCPQSNPIMSCSALIHTGHPA